MTKRTGTIVAGVVALVFIVAAVVVATSLGSALDEAAPLITTLLALVGIVIPALIGLARIEEVQTETKEVKAVLAQTRDDLNNGLLKESVKEALTEEDVAKVADVEHVVTNHEVSEHNNRKAV